MTLQTGILFVFLTLFMGCLIVSLYFNNNNRKIRKETGNNILSEKVPELFFIGFTILFGFLSYFMAYLFAQEGGLNSTILTFMGKTVWIFGMFGVGLFIYMVIYGIKIIREDLEENEDRR